MTSTAYPTGRHLSGLSRPASFAVVVGCYLIAGLAALVTATLLRHHHAITTTFAADVVATVVVFLLSAVLANASLYDPYWSVAPPIVAIAWVAAAPSGLAT